MTEVVFDWPPPQLSPNARSHWAKKAKITKAYRKSCFFLAKASGVKVYGEKIALDVRFCPPDRRRRDADNMIASVKALFDGLADALGVNDARFVITYQVADTIEGKVRVTVC